MSPEPRPRPTRPRPSGPLVRKAPPPDSKAPPSSLGEEDPVKARSIKVPSFPEAPAPQISPGSLGSLTPKAPPLTFG